jgi:hypothetical protein
MVINQHPIAIVATILWLVWRAASTVSIALVKAGRQLLAHARGTNLTNSREASALAERDITHRRPVQRALTATRRGTAKATQAVTGKFRRLR